MNRHEFQQKSNANRATSVKMELKCTNDLNYAFIKDFFSVHIIRHKLWSFLNFLETLNSISMIKFTFLHHTKRRLGWVRCVYVNTWYVKKGPSKSVFLNTKYNTCYQECNAGILIVLVYQAENWAASVRRYV